MICPLKSIQCNPEIHSLYSTLSAGVWQHPYNVHLFYSVGTSNLVGVLRTLRHVKPAGEDKGRRGKFYIEMRMYIGMDLG